MAMTVLQGSPREGKQPFFLFFFFLCYRWLSWQSNAWRSTRVLLLLSSLLFARACVRVRVLACGVG